MYSDFLYQWTLVFLSTWIFLIIMRHFNISHNDFGLFLFLFNSLIFCLNYFETKLELLYLFFWSYVTEIKKNTAFWWIGIFVLKCPDLSLESRLAWKYFVLYQYNDISYFSVPLLYFNYFILKIYLLNCESYIYHRVRFYIFMP